VNAVPDAQYEGIDNLEALAGAARYNRFLVETALRARPGAATVLDFGAGLGTLAAAWADRGLAVSCVEPDAHLRAELARRGLHALGTLEAAPDGSFDLVCAINVLEHIQDDVAVLARLGRKLRPGGRVFIWVPAFPLLWSSMDRKVGHCRRYTRGEVRRAAERAGLGTISVRYADSLGFFATLLYKWFARSSGEVSASSVRLYDAAVFPVSRFLDRIGARLLFGKNLMAVLERDAGRIVGCPAPPA
jgi:SAM-dependent methyltransferase